MQSLQFMGCEGNRQFTPTTGLTLNEPDRTVLFVIHDSLKELYSSKTNDELLELAADDMSLREDAKTALADELERRSLQRPKQKSTDLQRPLSTNPALSRALTFALALIVSMCVALFLTPVLETGLGTMFHPHSLAALLWKWCTLDFLCAAGAGFSMYRIWKTKAAMWTWILPAIWFGLMFVLAAFSEGRQSLWSQFSGADCINGLAIKRHFTSYGMLHRTRDQLVTQN